MNENFEPKNSYRLQGNKNIKVQDKINYGVNVNQNAANAIRDNIVNQEIFRTCFILSQNHLPDTIEPPTKKNIALYRLNQCFCRPNYYQKLKELTSG